jgi:hypothetical protein
MQAGPTHPVYITESIVGGKNSSDETVYAGGEAFHGTTTSPSTFYWAPPATAPKELFYQCYVHQKLGWKIQLMDAGDHQGAPAAGRCVMYACRLPNACPQHSCRLTARMRPALAALCNMQLQPTRQPAARRTRLWALLGASQSWSTIQQERWSSWTTGEENLLFLSQWCMHLPGGRQHPLAGLVRALLCC